MSDDLKELVSKADRGDESAQGQLMDMAREKESAGEYKEAAELFKLAAMAYRIASSRKGGLLADAYRSCAKFVRTIRYYDEWVKKYTKPLAPRINRLRNHKGTFDRPILSMWREDSEYCSMLHFLEDKLREHDIEICAPGGTINRHFWAITQQREGFREFMNDIDVRIVLDPITDEVMKRMAADKSEYKSSARKKAGGRP